jgi:hypothetical protein
MARGMGLVVAGSLLLTMVGCSFESLSDNNGPRKEQIVTGSLTEVKTQVEKNLLQMQLAIIKSSRDGDIYRITSKSPAGEKFVLVLKRIKAEKNEGERTSMRIEWEKNPDEMFWGVLINAVANPASVGMPVMSQQYGMQGQPPYGMQGQQPPYGMQGQQPPYGMQGQPPYGMQGQPPYGMQGQQPPYGMQGQQLPYGVQGQQQFGGSGQ